MARPSATLPEGVPKLTLGWGAIHWSAKYLKHANGLRAGKNFRMRDSQARFLLWFYALNPDGSWVYDHGVRRWPKGSGKSPFAAVHALTEFLGPVRLDRWDANAPGGCVGKPQPMAHVQIAATTLDQTANTMRQVRAMARKGTRVQLDYNLDVGMLRFNGPAGSLLEVITSSAAAAEGAEVTFAVADETEHWTPGRGGRALMDVLDRNLGKSGSRMVETCNAWQPGEHSVAEESWSAWEAEREGRVRGEGRTLYDARVPAADVDLTDRESLDAAIEWAYGDTTEEQGGWVNVAGIRNKIWKPSTKDDTARRFYLNMPTASTDAWMARSTWEAIAEPNEVVGSHEPIAMFFDGSKSRDATALVGCRISDGFVFLIDMWEPDPRNPDDQIPSAAVELAVDRAFEYHDVVGFFGDVNEWEYQTKTLWPEKYGDRLLVHSVPTGKDPQVVAFDMRGHGHEFTHAVELCESEIREGKFRHDGDSRVARHVANARRHPNRSGVSIRKESKDSPLKIDGAVCVVGARHVRSLVLGSKAWASRSRAKRGMTVW